MGSKTLLVADTSPRTFDLQLFGAQQEIVDILAHEPDPLFSFVQLHTQLVAGFAKAFTGANPASFGMDDITAEKVDKEIAFVQKGIDWLTQAYTGQADLSALQDIIETKDTISL